MPSSLDRLMTDELIEKTVKTAVAREARFFSYEELDDVIHNEEQVKAIIELRSESISQVDADGFVSIQKAAMRGESSGSRSSFTFIPLMVREGCRLNVGGEENRGGLLSLVSNDENGATTMEYLIGSYHDSNGGSADKYDLKRVKVLEELRDMNHPLHSTSCPQKCTWSAK